MTHNLVIRRFVPPTSGEAIWLARRVAATRRSRGAADREGGGTSDA